MKFRAVLMVAWLLTLNRVVADVLVVTTEGKSVWATSARKEGDAVLYLEKETGEEKKAPIAKLDGVISAVQRGKAYKAEEIQKNIENLKKLKSKHPGLTRQLNELLQGWEALTKPSPEFENQIANLVNEFAVSDKGTRAYRKVTLDLGMIKFKDVQGAFASRVDAVCEEIKKEYVATNMTRLVRMASAEKIGADNFVSIKRLAVPVSEAAEAADREKIKTLVAKTRLMAFDSGLRQAETIFASGKSVDAYLRSSAILFLLDKEVADTADQKAGVERRIGALQDTAGRTLSGYTFFDKGFPLTEEDQKLFSKTRSFAARVTFTSFPLDERCLVIPTQSPGRIRMGQPFRLPVRLIFNSAQPTNGVFGMVVMITGKADMGAHAIKLPAFRIQHGRADIVLSEDFSGVEKGFELGRDADGDICLYFYLASLKDDCSGAAKEDWDAISMAWRLRMDY